MEGLHRYLMARHHVEDYDNYMQLLAMFRNTTAIEELKGRKRMDGLRKIIGCAHAIRQELVTTALSRRRS
jgi:hypothetical protein